MRQLEIGADNVRGGAWAAHGGEEGVDGGVVADDESGALPIGRAEHKEQSVSPAEDADGERVATKHEERCLQRLAGRSARDLGHSRAGKHLRAGRALAFMGVLVTYLFLMVYLNSGRRWSE